MTRPVERVRAIAIGVIVDGDRLLVAEGFDPASEDQVFYRPIGGSIEFGEPAALTVQREYLEEMGAEVVDPRPLGTLENRFTFEGGPGHEVVMVFETRLADPSLTARDEIACVEEGGQPFTARWLPLDVFRSGAVPLYPDGLLALVESSIALQRDTPDRRHFLLGAGAVVVAPDGRILMLEQERRGRVEWSSPGGALERDESVHDAAQREVKEETGLDVRLERLIRISEFWNSGHLSGVGFLFLARPDPWPQEVHLPERDGLTRLLGHRWCTRDEVASLPDLWEHDISRNAWPPEITTPLFERLETVAD